MRLLMRLFCMTVFFIGVLSILAACGNKGPLFLPDSEPAPVTVTPTTPPAATTIKEETEQ